MVYKVAHTLLGQAVPSLTPFPPTTSRRTESAGDDAPTLIIGASNTIVLSETVLQGTKGEAKLLSREELVKAKARYRTHTGNNPPEDERVSREQLTAFNAAIKGLDSIFVDVAVWVPFWVRFSKRHRFLLA